MKYTKENVGIRIYSKEEFNPEHILECGQVFCYKKDGEIYKVFPNSYYAEIIEENNSYFIKTDNIDYFINYFDLDKDYSKIKQDLSKFSILNEPVEFGYGIRILNQDLFETMISFIISSNNNIKRIKLILNNIRRALGEKLQEDIFTFPSFEKLVGQDEQFFKDMGAGYRAKYLYNVLKQISPEELDKLKQLPTISLRNKLISLSGIGPKVADCLLLFGYHRGDSFPVDTWVEKIYNRYYLPLSNRELIRKNLVEEFGELSGYAQQYLFYFQRSGN